MPRCSFFGSKDIDNSSMSPKKRSFSNELQIIMNNHNDINSIHAFKEELEFLANKDENKDELIDILRKDLNELQIKYDRDLIETRIEFERELRMELEQEIRSQIEDEIRMRLNKNMNINTKQKTKTRNMGTQTKVLGFWERLFSKIRCLPIDENNEW